MRTTLLRFLALAGALLLVGSALQAQGPGRGFRDRQHPGVLFAGLGLTEAQKAQAKEIRDKHQEAMRAKGEAFMAAQKTLRQALVKPETEAATLKTLHEKAANAQFELLMARRTMAMEILPLLTTEQKDKLEKRMGSLEAWAPMGPRPRR